MTAIALLKDWIAKTNALGYPTNVWLYADEMDV